MRVVVAMSGGVDSSVAAALLKEEGHEVIGVTMQLWPRDTENGRGSKGCCGLEAIDDARRVAYKLGIPHYVMDFREVFARRVIDEFGREYRTGRTPNPCVLCNRRIKFDVLRERARELGADFIATGHHARVESDGGTCLLKKGADARKDQSYFLGQLSREQLRHAMFPVGRLTKARVREIAAGLGLAVAEKPESQEICFVPDDDYAVFLRDYLTQDAQPGPIVDGRGNRLGEHKGIASYTIGQRRGLGIAAGEPRYVTAIRPETSTVVVGTKEETYGTGLVAGDLAWLAIDPPEQPIEVKARVRYRHPEAEATVSPLGNDEVYVKFAEPQMAITPGQAVVFYDGDTVIGGGTISRQGR
ncbi:MAG: tRNA 2-thiouridine(34) synthase MnmA [Chloroflexota bacterium]